MQIGEAVRTSAEEIRAHPLRSLFTLIGVILGTLALVVVLSVLEGITLAVWDGVADLGLDGVLIINQRTPTDRVERAKAHLSRGLRIEDIKWFQSADTITHIGPVGETRAVITAGRVVRRVAVYGITPEFVKIRNRRASAGRFISDGDVASNAAVCVLGYKLKQKTFGGDNALGQQVTVGGRRLTVIGVGTQFNMEFVNDDDMERETGGVYMPFSTYADLFGRSTAISYLLAQATTPEMSVEAEEEAAQTIARAHSGIHDARIENVGKEIQKTRAEVQTIIRNWGIVFFAIAGVSLLIGGVGIFSVLKISVSERLYEIGLRKAMGATDGEIFAQFLIESITLSVFGALVGVGGGIVVVKIIANFFPAGLPLSLFGLGLASGFAVSVGLLSGVYPSFAAARMQPVEALRA
jgi:putative ABC transport system permease protein